MAIISEHTPDELNWVLRQLSGIALQTLIPKTGFTLGFKSFF